MAESTPLRLSDAPSESAFDDRVYGGLAVVLILGFFGFIALAFCVPSKLPGDTLGLILGNLMGWVSAIVFFRWGSSSSSRAKDATIQKLTNGKP